MADDVFLQWEEPLEKHEITHQLEPGEARPTRMREGRLLSIYADTHNLREGFLTTTPMAAVLTETPAQIVTLPLSSFRVARAPTIVLKVFQEDLLASVTKSADERIAWEAAEEAVNFTGRGPTEEDALGYEEAA